MVEDDYSLDWSPPVAFYFNVAFQEEAGIPDTAFQEVSGLKLELEVEALNEGGENQFRHQLPVGARHGNVILKRALLPVNHAFESWVTGILEGGLLTGIQTYDMVVTLIDSEDNPLRAWGLTNVYPVKWEAGSFDARKNELVIETLELSYNELYRLM